MTQQQLELRSQRLKERELDEKERANRNSERLKGEELDLKGEELGMSAEKTMLQRKGLMGDIAAPFAYLGLTLKSSRARDTRHGKGKKEDN